MVTFKIHDKNSAPDAAKAALDEAERKFGMSPNVLGIMAESPPALKGYLSLSGLFEQTTLTPEERNVVLLASSFENECDYCMAAHTAEAKQAGVDETVIEALRNANPVDDERLEALRELTAKVVHDRGHLSEENIDAFLAAGYSKQNILEVILAVAMKTLSNYTNHVADTPLDAAMEPFAWESPGVT